jgi:WD40 repeat protein
MSKPARGAAFAEPVYKTCVVRATDHKADGFPDAREADGTFVSGFARNDYARRQAFNADSSVYIINGYVGGTWHIYNAKTLGKIKELNAVGLGGSAEPQWHPTNPELLYYIPSYGIELNLRELNINTGAVRVVGDFASRLKAIWPTANAAWTKNEGSPSKDARYWCLMVDDANWKGLGVITWDRDTDTIVGRMNVTDRPDNVTMSPTGNYCIVAGDSGTIAYSRDFSQKRLLRPRGEHADLALDANGEDVYVSINYDNFEGGEDLGDVFMMNVRTGQYTSLFATYLSRTYTAAHFSGKAFSKPGWIVVSTYADGNVDGAPSRQWLHKKVMAVQLKANPTIYNLAFTHGIANKYWTEPQASVNADFTKVLFNSNWEVDSPQDVDAYMIELPAGAVK